LAPLFAFGHACEFLVARLEVKTGAVALEITADYGANPLIADEDAARAAVKRILQVRANGQPRSLEDLAPMRLERRTQWDAEAPASFSPPPDDQEHQLLTATWRWQPDGTEIAFAVPKGSHHDVLLWTRDEHLPGRQAKWMLLIEGESTPVIPIQHNGSGWWYAGLLLPLLIIAWPITRRMLSINRKSPAPPRLEP